MFSSQVCRLAGQFCFSGLHLVDSLLGLLMNLPSEAWLGYSCSWMASRERTELPWFYLSWSLILWQASLNLFMWKLAELKRKIRSLQSLLRIRLRIGTDSLLLVFIDQSLKDSSDSRAGGTTSPPDGRGFKNHVQREWLQGGYSLGLSMFLPMQCCSKSSKNGASDLR